MGGEEGHERKAGFTEMHVSFAAELQHGNLSVGRWSVAVPG